MRLRVEKHGAGRAGERVWKNKTGSGGADMPVRWHGGKPDSFNTAPGLSFVFCAEWEANHHHPHWALERQGWGHLHRESLG